MKRTLVLFLIASMVLLSSCSKESRFEELDFGEPSIVESSAAESNVVESNVVESNVVESNVVESSKVELLVDESSSEETDADAKSNLDLSEFKLSDKNTEYDAYVNVAIPLGLLGKNWNSPEELDAESILTSIGYFNQFNSETTDNYYIEEAELEDYVLSKVDISVDKLRNTSHYSDGKYHFKVMRDVGGMLPLEMRDYWDIEGDTYILIRSLITEERNILKIDSDGKFVSYTLKE